MATKALQIPKGAHTEIVGPGGSTIKRIQQAHNVRIVVPGRQVCHCLRFVCACKCRKEALFIFVGIFGV
jgi:hypothetical protein